MDFLSVSDIHKEINGKASVNGVSFLQKPFEKIAISGETGSGKTSVLKMIAGLMQPGKGNIYFKEERVLGPLEQLIPGHPKIAYLSQHFELRNNYRVEEELEYKNVLPAEQAETIFTICQIDHLLKRKTDQLSGGERQRIVLARLLIAAPELLLLDEPFSNLDIIHTNTIKKVLQDTGERLGISFIMVSHDAEDVLSWADKILVMKDGRILQEGSPRTIYHHPVDEYTAGLFGAYNLIDGELFDSRVHSKIFLRPGDLKLVRPGEAGIKGEVLNIQFKGAYYAVSLSVKGSLIEVFTENTGLARGDQAGIVFPQIDFHQLKTRAGG